jgi:aminocarboxymuconate-semialdehyde decarboxylase
VRVDFQCHIFPRGFVKHLTSSSGQLRVEGPDQLGRHVILDSKTGTTLTYYRENTPFLDPERHLADMKTYGIDLQVLSVNPPGVDRVEDKDEALRLSKVINDDLSGLVKAHADKFVALATIPMNDPEVATDEIRRAVGEMGFAGINIPSNTRGGFYDDPAFDKVYGLLERYDVPVFMHPSEPIVQGSMGLDYNLPLVFGWPFDTTISLSRIVFSGVLTRFPKLKLVAAHGGGMIPFYGGRLEMLLHDMRGKGKLPVKESVRDLKRVYYEAAVFSPGAVQLLLSFAGEDNVVYGTDYPFGKDEGRFCYEASLKTMDALKADPKVKSKVLGDNALGLLKLA